MLTTGPCTNAFLKSQTSTPPASMASLGNSNTPVAQGITCTPTVCGMPQSGTSDFESPSYFETWIRLTVKDSVLRKESAIYI